MRIVTSKQMKQIEQNSIQYQMSFLRLMENAGCAAARLIADTLHDVNGLNFVVFCGKGNNGGDGFVVARKLHELGANAAVVLTDGEPKTDDATRMLEIVRSMELPVFSFEEEPEMVNTLMDKVDVIVDAIFGSGFHGEIDIRRRQITSMINSAIAAVFSLDIPSGINCDTGEAAEDAVNADFTIAFDSFKPAHLLPKYLPQLGQVSLAGIGIDPLAYEGIEQNQFVADEDLVYSSIPQRSTDAHKTST
ncbi:MAG: NAD(P)H-hydrate epimerase, partial [Negativibacillus sp.]|nr:NAD(P)H-hydrate epimerase [Negativibacillus sp.]